MSTPAQQTRLVADVGGTNSRLALYDPANNSLRARRDYANENYDNLTDVIAQWLEDLPEAAPTLACLAIAAPPFDDEVIMGNLDWSFSIRETAARFKFDTLRVINDFEGNAYGLVHLEDDDIETLLPGKPGGSGKLAAVGPGTGLGGATFGLVAGQPVANACEPGSMSLSPATQMELELFRLLLKDHSDIYAELLLSGPGIPLLYHSIATLMGEQAEALTAEEISQRALSGSCGLCTQTMETFCALLGSACGDFVLAQGAYGGLYLCGGILPQIRPVLSGSSFTHRFAQKGIMQKHLADVPLHLIISGRAGLLGAAHAPLA